MDEDLYTTYLGGLLSGNRTVCNSVIEELLQADTPILDIYVHIFQRSMYEVGRKWEDGTISVAVVYSATVITERLLTTVYPRLFKADHVERSAVVTCAPTELHQIGARMVADAFELYGWDGYFLGARTPEDDLISMINDRKPDIVALSASLYKSMTVVVPLLHRLRDRFPDQDIIVGGQGFSHNGTHTELEKFGIHYVPSLDELKKTLTATPAAF